jgi:hypothetical protein
MTLKEWAVVFGLAIIAIAIKTTFKAWIWLQKSYYFCRSALFDIEQRRS